MRVEVVVGGIKVGEADSTKGAIVALGGGVISGTDVDSGVQAAVKNIATRMKDVIFIVDHGTQKAGAAVP